MDFNSLSIGSSFYVLRRNGLSKLCIGTVKSKTNQQPQFGNNPNLFNGPNLQTLLNFVVNIDGNDEVFDNIPANIEIAARGNDTFSCNKDAIIAAVGDAIASNKKEIDMYEFRNNDAIELEKILETLNPRYADEKKRDSKISELEKRQSESDKKLDDIKRIVEELASNDNERSLYAFLYKCAIMDYKRIDDEKTENK